MKQATIWAILCLASSTVFSQELNVTFLHTPAKVATPGVDLVINGNIVGADQVSIAALNFRTQGETEFQVRELKLIAGEQYRGVIPGKHIKPPALEYFCYAVDFDGNRRTIFSSAESPHRIEVAAREPAGDNWADESSPKQEVAEEEADTKDRRPKIPMADREASYLVSAARIEAMGAATLAEVLDNLAGLSVSRTVSGSHRLAVRGIGSDAEVLVLLDGHRINDLYTGASLLEFPAEAIQRLEVLTGPGSLRHGSGALVGVVNVVTRKSEQLRARAGYGGFNTLRLSGQGGYRNETFGLTGQVQFVNADGQDRRVTSDGLTGIQGDDPVSNAPEAVEDRRTQLHAQLQGELPDLGGGELALLAHYLFQTRGALVGKYDTLDSGSELSIHQVNLDLSYRVPLGSRLTLDSRAILDIDSTREIFRLLPAGQQPYRAGDLLLTDGLSETISSQSMSLGGEVLVRASLAEQNTLVGGLQFEHLGLSDLTVGHDTGSVGCPAGSMLQVRGYLLSCDELQGEASGKSRMVFGFFAEDRWNDLLDGLDLSAGFRLDYLSDIGLTVTPQGSVGYRPIDGLRFEALYAQAFRAPTFQELYQQPAFDPLRGIRGNQELEVVKVHTLQLSVLGEIATRPVRYQLRGVFFFNWIRDSIAPGDGMVINPQLENNESLDVLGVEGELVARFGRRNRVFANGSWFRAKVAESYLTDVPQARFNLGLDLALCSWLDLHLGVQYGSERRNNTRRELEFFRPFRIPAYTLVRAGLSTEPVLFGHLTLFVNVTNAFDHDLRDPVPRPDRLPGLIPRAPFSFLAGIGWRP